MAADEAKKHHHVPQFYMRHFGCADDQNKVMVLERHRNVVVADRKSIEGIGYEERLHDYMEKGLLYTRGSVPYYGTCPGLRVPRPLLLVPHEHTDGTILTLAKDVLALTKVNWNTTQFDQKLPAPIKAPREVGRILKHIEFGTAVSPDFRKYA